MRAISSVLLVLWFLFPLGANAAEKPNPIEIIRRIDRTERVSSSATTYRQTITTSRGGKRTLLAKTYSKDFLEKQLIVYTGPARIKGDKILMLDDGDEIYFYTPRTDRVRHLAAHAKRQKAMGSDFSYEDLAGGKLEEKFKATLLGEEKVEGVRCFKFELVPTESGPHYSKLIYWADKKRYVSVRIDYHSEGGELLKRLVLSDYAAAGGQLYARKMVMTNLREGGSTTIETLDAEFGVELPDEMFRPRSLRKR